MKVRAQFIFWKLSYLIFLVKIKMCHSIKLGLREGKNYDLGKISWKLTRPRAFCLMRNADLYNVQRGHHMALPPKLVSLKYVWDNINAFLFIYFYRYRYLECNPTWFVSEFRILLFLSIYTNLCWVKYIFSHFMWNIDAIIFFIILSYISLYTICSNRLDHYFL